jgi:glucosamine-6-phosphate deaminase
MQTVTTGFVSRARPGFAPVEDFSRLRFEDFARRRPFPFRLAENAADLNRRIAGEAVGLIERAGREGRPLLMILPVGPLDYAHWARLCNERNVSCAGLTILGMDEYLADDDAPIEPTHPMSFRGFIDRTLVAPLQPQLRPRPDQVRFPDPREPAAATALVESFGGADVCYGGMGITGHFAFNDPPGPGEPAAAELVRDSRTRCLAISRESATQMAMGGVDGNWDILPRRAVTLGMYELLRSKRIHLTFMRSWHAGVLRRALFGPVTAQCPGSFLQEHPNVEVTLTRLAARVPRCNVAQALGEEGEP